MKHTTSRYVSGVTRPPQHAQREGPMSLENPEILSDWTPLFTLKAGLWIPVTISWSKVSLLITVGSPKLSGGRGEREVVYANVWST
jgi:hypothetical protein